MFLMPIFSSKPKFGKLGSIGLSVAVLAIVLTASCSSVPKTGEPSPSAPVSVELLGAKSVWKMPLNSLVADLDVARVSGQTLISTVPNFEREDGARDFRSLLISPSGVVEATVVQPYRVRSQTLSEDGKRFITANYEDQVSAFDGTGKKLWEIEAHCRPRILNRSQKVLCYHDDDVKPGVAFEVFSWEGKALSKYPVTGDALAIEISHDEQNVVLALTGGQIHLLGPQLKTVWTQKVEGEVLDVAVTDGPSPRVFALVLGKNKASDLVAFNAKGKKLTQFSSITHAYQQIGVAPDGTGVFLMGNGSTGQVLSFYALDSTEGTTLSFEHKWTRREPSQADYSSPLVIGESSVLFGTAKVYERASDKSGDKTSEKSEDTTRSLTRISGFSIGSGQAVWSIPVTTDEGAYLFQERRDPTGGGSSVVIATDEGVVMSYQTVPPVR